MAKGIRAKINDKVKFSGWSNRFEVKAEIQAGIIMLLYPPVLPEIYEKVYADILEKT